MTDIRPGHTDAEIMRLSRQANQSIFFRTVAVISVTLLGIVGWFSAAQYNKARDAAGAAKEAAAVVRDAAVANCERSVQPGGARYIIASTIQAQIAQSKHFDYHSFFPNVEPKQLHNLIEQQNKQRQSQIDALLNVNCPSQYPHIAH